MHYVLMAIMMLIPIPASSSASNLSDQTVCRRAINSDRTGWIEGFYTEEAKRRGLTFRACDEMNNPPLETRAATPPPSKKVDEAPIDSVAIGVAATLFYDKNCEKLPLGIMYMVKAFSQTVSAADIARANNQAQQSYDILPKVFCLMQKPIVERLLSELRSAGF